MRGTCLLSGFAILATAVSVSAQTGQATGTRVPVRAGTSVRTSGPGLLPGTRSNVFTIIQGNAMDAANTALPNVIVRLRDVRYGRIVDSQVTDSSGLFAFRAVDPGMYIIELLGGDDSVLAASPILYVKSGEIVTALVKLPFVPPPLGGFFGRSAVSALAVASAAAAAGVLANEVTGIEASNTQVTR